MAMEMDHSFTVPVSPDRAWDVLLDVERIAPCMPGATVDEFDGEVVTGRIKVKVGPVSLTYRGTAKFTERDADAKVIVLDASGKETRGAGTASATVRATLEPESGGAATKATMHTTMNVTGRPAQFGRGVMVEVGGKLVEKFAENLARQLTQDSAGQADGMVSTVAAPSTPDTVDGPTGSAGIFRRTRETLFKRAQKTGTDASSSPSTETRTARRPLQPESPSGAHRGGNRGRRTASARAPSCAS